MKSLARGRRRWTLEVEKGPLSPSYSSPARDYDAHPASDMFHHSDTWLGTLNLITPPLSANPSPTPGPEHESDRTLSSLSFPIASADLYASLEAWSNVHFSGLDDLSPPFPCDLPDPTFEERPSFGTLPTFEEQAFVNPFAAVQPALFHLDTGAFVGPLVHAPAVEPQQEVVTPAGRKKAVPKAKGGKKAPEKAIEVGPGEGEEERSAYEEDKRRRNTAASSALSFRVRQERRGS